jgi:nonsense-mediated mRNA decay protein 3
MRRFCVKCGKQKNKLIGSLCPDCYLEKNQVIGLPEKMQIEMDSHSGKYRLGRLWLEPTDENLFKYVKDKIKSLAKGQLLQINSLEIKFERQQNNIVALVSFETFIEDVKVKVEKSLLIQLIKSISDASMKLASNYHEAILQVRFKEKFTKSQAKEKMQEIIGLLHKYKKIDVLSDVVNIKDVKGGFDMYVASKKYARKVSDELSKKYRIKAIYSNKLIGMKDGREIYRDYLCLKF